MLVQQTNGGSLTRKTSEYEEGTHGATTEMSSQSESEFELVEVMLWHDGIGFAKLHLDRMAASALHFGWPFDRASAERLIASQISALQATERLQVRLSLAAGGNMHVRVDRFLQPRRFGRVSLAKHRTVASDVFRRHQTTYRAVYDRLLVTAQQQGFDDFIFSNDRGELTEGAVHSVFIKSGSKLLTPPIDCGVLPGVYRRYVLETNPCAEEQILRPQDLKNAETIYLTSSLLGMYPVELST